MGVRRPEWWCYPQRPHRQDRARPPTVV